MSLDALLADARRTIAVVSLDEVARRLRAGEPMVLLDVRERDEIASGVMPGALTIPRGLLEMEIERRVPDRDAPLVVYCAAGARSALAAKTLGELGYRRVEAADPGFSRWKDLGHPVERPPTLTPAQRERYARHLLLPEIGEKGQLQLLAAKILVLGAGGLGSPAALYLAAAGVGTIGLCDHDLVDASNLQRQILHGASRVGQPKVESAEQRLRDLDPDVKVVKIPERLRAENVARIFAGFDVIVDGCDNFPTRYLVNDASVFLRKPVVHGSIFRFEGQVTTFAPDRGGPCYRCMYPAPPPPGLTQSCQEAGVLGVLPGVIGVLQATEAIKLVLGRGDPLVGRLVTFDALRLKFGELRLRRDRRCPVCGDEPTIRDYIDYEGFCNLR